MGAYEYIKKYLCEQNLDLFNKRSSWTQEMYDKFYRILCPPLPVRYVKNSTIAMYPDELEMIWDRNEIRLRYKEDEFDFDFSFEPTEVHISTFYLPTSTQGQGVAKGVMKKLIAFALELGIRKFTLSAFTIGRYAWAKYGFNAPEDFRKLVQTKISQLSGQTLYKNDSPVENHIAFLAACRMKNTKEYQKYVKTSYGKGTLETLLKDYVLDDELLIGKYVLLEWTDSWKGVLDLNNSIDNEINTAYLSGIKIESLETKDDKKFLAIIDGLKKNLVGELSCKETEVDEMEV